MSDDAPRPGSLRVVPDAIAHQSLVQVMQENGEWLTLTCVLDISISADVMSRHFTGTLKVGGVRINTTVESR